ncbi:zinc finger protein 703-B-like [Amphiura filiformis]|uniref:zinc finger protein 703-B-like n=1 Tax=Amphiura filiformis TaxID=82378 RepID=UPI003B2254D4
MLNTTAIMLATRSQPLMHTEYLQPLDPLPTTLDAKKSPLALLAQTCSSIGKPDPPPPSNDIKRALTPHDIPSGKLSPSEKAATGYDKPSFKPYKQHEKKDGDATVFKLGLGYPHPPKTASPQTGLPPRPSSREHLKSTSAPTSPVAAVKPKTESIPPMARTPPTGSPASQTSHCGDHRISSVPKHSAPLPAQTAPHVISSFPSLSASYKQTASSGHCGCSSTTPSGHVPYLSEHHAHKHSDSNPQSPYAAAYARVKTADGGTTLMPICRDPYCNNCQSAQIAAAASSCTQSSGCTQCRHDNIALNAGGFPVALPVAGALPYLPTSLASAAIPNPYLYSYSHAAIPATAQSEPGHVCNWVSGSTSCGKRFASSEELLQHLRTHTMSSSEVSNASALSATLNAQLSAYYMQYPTMAANHFGQFAKSPFTSALSPGTAAAIRYHPYKSSVPPQITALPGLPAGYYPYPLHDLKARFPTGVPH